MPSLIGNKPNQVPSNGDLGTLAFQDASSLNVGAITVNSTSTQRQTTVQASTVASEITGNSNAQGTATWRTVVRQVPVVSLGTQLIIPFISQGGLNQTTIIRLTGTSAMFNNASNSYGFSAYISVGHLTSISASSWDLGGNVASVTTSGMNVIVAFTNAYTSATANGVFICLEYLCPNPAASIDIANIVMN
jgi:hypothetical protein